jgi:hypothetical protein
MRSIWAVVVACLVAVAGVRPIELAAHDRDDDRGTSLAQATAARAVLARRDGEHRPDLQLPAARRVCPRCRKYFDDPLTPR